jgi:hypothetical protein
VSFIFRCALIFVDTYAHTLFLEVNFNFQIPLELREYFVRLLELICPLYSRCCALFLHLN